MIRSFFRWLCWDYKMPPPITTEGLTFRQITEITIGRIARIIAAAILMMVLGGTAVLIERLL